ncbi:MAG: hypothetical protein AB7H93_05860 [Vicinamibacterales bacterium]
MNRTRVFAAAAALSGLAFLSWPVDPVARLDAQAGQVPIFEYDPTFPQPFEADKENWAIGQIGGMAVDSQDHIWVVHRPGGLFKNERFSGADDTPPKADCCVPAPPVLELDQAGKLIRAWGGPSQTYEWPASEHGIFVDPKGTVWLAGNGGKDNALLLFTREGKFIKQYGKRGMNKGSADLENFGSPANLTIDPATNEAYVADGYGNRRVMVIDAATGAFKRMWGAYGNKPDDGRLGPYDPDAPPAQQFRLPHNISISRDGLVYVADRPNNRIQVFKKDGTYVKEAFVSKRTMLSGAVSGFALSADPQQRFLYMIDGANHHVWILERDSLKVVARFGQHGLSGGALHVPHAIAVDSRGNIYVGENFEGKRFQRFLYRGLGTPKPGMIPRTTLVQ